MKSRPLPFDGRGALVAAVLLLVFAPAQRARAQQAAVNPFTYLGRVMDASHAAFDTNRVATSLLRHPFHPQHDGLRWDFSTPAPSGDILDNYKGDVKPETFSVRNSIQLFPRIEAGAERWNPQDAVPGGCIWTFDGLRREGTIYALGDATFRRVSTLA